MKKRMMFTLGRGKRKEQEAPKNDLASVLEQGTDEEMLESLQREQDISGAIRFAIEQGKAPLIARHLSQFPDIDHVETASLFIQSGEGSVVIEHLTNFHLNHSWIAYEIIDSGEGSLVAENIAAFDFEGLDRFVVYQLINVGEGEAVAKHLPEMSNIDHKAVADRLLAAGSLESLAKHLPNFNNLDHDRLAQEFIARGKGDVVALFVQNFTIDQRVLVRSLIQNQQGESVAKHLSKMHGVDHESVIDDLLQQGSYGSESVVTYADQFDVDPENIFLKLVYKVDSAVIPQYLKRLAVDQQKVVDILIQKGSGWRIVPHISKFDAVSHDTVVRALMDKGGMDAQSVAEFFPSFKGVDHTDVALMLLEKGQGRSLAEYITHFSGLSNDVARGLARDDRERVIAEHMERFDDLNADTANTLITAGYGNRVAENIQRFIAADHKNIAWRLLQHDLGDHVAKHIKGFQIDRMQYAAELMKDGQAKAVVEYMLDLDGMDPQEVILSFVEFCGLWYLEEHRSAFTHLDSDAIIDRALRVGRTAEIAEHLSLLEGVDHVALAERLIQEKEGWAVMRNLSSFEGIDHVETAHKVIAAGEVQGVVDYVSNIAFSSRKEASDLFEALKDRGDDIYSFSSLADTERYLSRRFRRVFDRDIRKTGDLFGDEATMDLHRYVITLMEQKTVPSELQRSGITESGEAGVRQLKKLVKEGRWDG
ncbi:MAG: hypothetical protein OYG31_02640 [Candidatus Kaiserbacteria bacterium]|nr:hypothetical protein [Candidatus Kaiserbacteria bacterium]